MTSKVPDLGLSPYAVDDLALSGLTPSDLIARPATAIEYAATGMTAARVPDGYVIPYFDFNGDPVRYYRVKILEATSGPKYRSMKDQPNHIYYPPGWAKMMKQPHPYVIITEGEKKAAAALKAGFPCIALSGVDNWRNRRITLPANTELKALKKDGPITAKIPPGDSNALVLVQDSGVVAVGFHDLIDFVVQQEMEIIIIFDTDKGGLKTQVQRAAAVLGYELRYRGLPIARIRQLILPPSKKGDKIGLDDFLMRKGTKEFAKILRVCRRKRIAFPRHPNPKTFVASRLQKARLSRKEVQDVSLSILMELETRGKRLRNIATQDMFYFNEKTHTLLDVHLASQRVMLHDTAFGSYLYREFNLSATDTRVVGWLAAQFNGEPGVDEVETQRVFAKPDDMKDCMAFQLSDSHFVIVTPNPEKPYIICENGSHGVLFEQGQVAPISHTAIETELEEQMESPDTLWKDVLGSFNFVPLSPSADDDGTTEEQLLTEGRMLAILLYYISPWLLRWKGLQLPVELVIGEPGSGKSSLYELRQTIITGYPRLSNMTNDIRDWYAGITGRGGLYVLDNIHFTGATKDYQQRLSDELCRLVTDPNPHVEQRKYYTNAQIITLPVSVTFALTSIEQPFYTLDLIQRSAIFELQVIQAGHDANWVQHQIQRGDGRIGWVAHQLTTIHKFLHRAVHQKKWDSNYRAGHRLAHYEQALMMMADVLDMPSAWIPSALRRQTATKMSEADWTMAGIGEFVAAFKKHNGDDSQSKRFSAADIVLWAEGHETYSKNGQMTNGWRLGKYLKSHRGTLQKTTGAFENGTQGNRIMYSVQ